MKTAEKLAAGWLLTLGFMFLTISVSAVITKNTTLKPILPGIDDQGLVKDFVNHEALNQLDNTATQGIMFGIPTAVLGGWLALGLYKQSKQNKKAINQQMNEHLRSLEQAKLSQFYQMLQENQGRVTLLGFAMQSQLPATEAKEYLDAKAKEFNANFQVNEEGGVSYHFDV
ncbi:hypothetical protein H6G54_10305 [Anabaena cylindrica FACHB-243]|nr:MULTISPECIES: hypothetical protein [Anabaena]MBD2418092.1 hypothetical protein [Anabaena cylindrica FACHB-243]MBY5281937.1 hypothetical protein [Anabaena sp. CCAP 1446/1C]MBY5310849.1 hypothetical protein [Anabaena sp. CCAP 1446/1C]MCM2407369.1 hypothetical protein [Anabaena sp. CCAP 1446/1C]